MHRFLLNALAGAAIIGSTIACDRSPMDSSMRGMDMDIMPNAADSTATAGYKSATMKMMQAMPKFSGDADVDFMKQMRSHHQAAIDMANVVLTNGKDEETKGLAREIVAAQKKEIAMIDAWLAKKGA